jgi:hypothetical protein
VVPEARSRPVDVHRSFGSLHRSRRGSALGSLDRPGALRLHPHPEQVTGVRSGLVVERAHAPRGAPARRLGAQCRGCGAETEIVEPARPHARALRRDSRHRAGSTGTVLLYGHYDKQPEFDGWRAGLGRGSRYCRTADCTAAAARTTAMPCSPRWPPSPPCRAAGIPHSRCVLLIEGCEESGSYDLPHLCGSSRRPDRHADLVICLDAECGNYDQLWVTTSLRGMLPGVLSRKRTLRGPTLRRRRRHRAIEFPHSAPGHGAHRTRADGALHPALHVEIPAAVQRSAGRRRQGVGRLVSPAFSPGCPACSRSPMTWSSC